MVAVTYQSTKTFTHAQGLSCVFRQWRAESHCRFLHGYALEIKITFDAVALDQRNWVMDFGGLKSVKEWLNYMFDHTLLVAADDPARDTLLRLGEGLAQVRSVNDTGCEAFAAMILNHVTSWLVSAGYTPRVWVSSVEVREHAGNSAIARSLPYA